MSKWKQGKSEAREQCPEGGRILTYIAGSGRVVRGEYGPRFQLDFGVEPGAENLLMQDGKPFTIRHWDGASIQLKSNMGKLFAKVRGRTLADAEMGTMDEMPAEGKEDPMPAEVEKLLSGLRVLAMVTHNDKGYANFHVDSCVRAPAQAASEGW